MVNASRQLNRDSVSMPDAARLALEERFERNLQEHHQLRLEVIELVGSEMVFEVQKDQPWPVLVGVARLNIPDGRDVLSLEQTVARFGKTIGCWQAEWRSVCGHAELRGADDASK